MTDTLSFSPRLAPASPLHPVRRTFTILPPNRSPRLAPHRSLPLLPKEDRVSQGMLVALLVATLPTVAYALLQAWHLAGGDTLTQAVRAFGLPVAAAPVRVDDGRSSMVTLVSEDKAFSTAAPRSCPRINSTIGTSDHGSSSAMCSTAAVMIPVTRAMSSL